MLTIRNIYCLSVQRPVTEDICRMDASSIKLDNSGEVRFRSLKTSSRAQKLDYGEMYRLGHTSDYSI